MEGSPHRRAPAPDSTNSSNSTHSAARTARKQGRLVETRGARSTSAEWRIGCLAGWECSGRR